MPVGGYVEDGVVNRRVGGLEELGCLPGFAPLVNRRVGGLEGENLSW